MTNEEHFMLEEKWIDSLKENAKLKNENSKLKAEIEQLKLSGDSVETSSIKYYNLYKKSLEQIARLKEQLEIKDNNFELYCDLVDENERLHERLEKSVELPCSIGTKIYFIRYEENDDCGNYSIGSGTFTYSWLDFPRQIFLTREDAEKSLKAGAEK